MSLPPKGPSGGSDVKHDKSPGGYIPGEFYGLDASMHIRESDKAPEVRKLVRRVLADIADSIIRTWLAKPGEYNLSVRIVMEKKS